MNACHSLPLLGWVRTVVVAAACLVAAACSGGGSPASVAPVGSNTLLVVTPPEGLTSAGIQGGQFFPLSKTYQLANSGTQSLNWVGFAETEGAVFLPDSGTLAPNATTSVTVFIDLAVAEQLGPGLYTNNAFFVNMSQLSNSIHIPVEVFVAENGVLAVEPAIGFSATGFVGGPFTPASQQYVLSNTGNAPLVWEASLTADWLSISQGVGTLTPGQSDTVTVSIDAAVAAAQPDGLYAGPLRFREVKEGNAGLQLLMSLNVETQPTLVVTPPDGFMSAGEPGGSFIPSSKDYQLTNTGDQDLLWSAASQAGLSNLTPGNGVLAPGDSVGVTVTVNAAATAGLPLGHHSDQIVFANNSGDGLGTTTRDVLVDLHDEVGDLIVSPNGSIIASGAAGGAFNPPLLTYTVWNIGDAPLTWVASAEQPWIESFPSSGLLAPGASADVVVSVDSAATVGLALGRYEGLAEFIPNTGRTIKRPVLLNVIDLAAPVAPNPLVEGAGFTGPTAQPSGIGSGPASGFHAVAQFDVVRWQEFTNRLEVGALAFHHRGIDRVEFSLNGGPWLPVYEPTLNPRTGVVEYWVTVEAGAPGVASIREVELRAIAYPVAGVPRVISSGILHARPDGLSPVVRYVSTVGSDSSGDGSASAPFRTIVHAAHNAAQATGPNNSDPVIRLTAGDYDFFPPTGSNTILENANHWLTIEPAEGVKRAEARITDGVNGGIKVRNVRFNDITFRKRIFSPSSDGTSYWFNRCDHLGYGAEVNFTVGWAIDATDLFWTGGLVRESRWGPMNGFVRGMTIRNLGEDCFNGANPILNTTIDGMDRGAQSSWHPDLIRHTQSLDNMLYYGIHATNIAAQGLFWKHDQHSYRKNQALVNVLIEGTGGFKSQVDSKFDHLIMRNCTIMQQFLWRAHDQGHHSFEGNIFFLMEVGTSTSPSLGSATLASIQANGHFDQNQFIYSASGITPGSNATQSAVNFVDEDGDDYQPLPGQGLNRADASWAVRDQSGALRPDPATLGALED